MPGEKTRKVEMNNEIVLLRQSVRQARICVINKLIREAKRLRNNHGSEKKLEKNKNKAEKLLREVQALKLVKDDEISKYGINNIENVQNVIQNQSTDDRIVAMAKVVRYKSLSAKITEFKEKFPEYEEYSTSTKKKKATSKKKVVKGSINDSSKTISKEQLQMDVDDSEAEVCTKKTNKALNEASSETQCEVHEKEEEEEEEPEEEKDDVDDNDDATMEAPVSKAPKIVRSKHPEKDKGNTLKVPKQSKESTSIVRVISKEATVKRFTEILQESTTEKPNVVCELNNDQLLDKPQSDERVEDDFFLGSRGFLNVVAPDTTEDVNKRTWNDESRSSGGFKVSRGKPKDSFFKGKARTQHDDASRRWNRPRESEFARPKHKTIDNVPVKRSRREYREDTSVAVESENLHPSWAAKKKQQDIMKGGFQGKKILFEED